MNAGVVTAKGENQLTESVVFLRGANAIGSRVFSPVLLASRLSDFKVLNIGAAGTFVVRAWSNAAGIAWLILFALLTAARAHELVAWSTDVVLAAFGVAAAIVAYRAARAT